MEIKKLSLWDMYCFVMNAMIGAGVLAIPCVYQRAGVVSSTIVLVAVVAVNWLLHYEVLTITEKLTLEMHYVKENSTCELKQPLLHSAVFIESTHHWDLPEVVRCLMGESHGRFYFVCYIATMIGTVTAYSNIFGTAFGSVVSDCDFTGEVISEDCMGKYRIGLIVFTGIIAILTVVDYHEQAALQYLMTGLQMVVVLSAIWYGISFGSVSSITTDLFVSSDIPAIGQMFSTLVFATVFHATLPSLIAVSEKEHIKQKRLTWLIFISSICIYGAMGIISSLLIPDLPDNISLLFRREMMKSDTPSMAFHIFAIAIIFTPVADICTNSPVYTQSLAGAITSSLFHTDHELIRKSRPVLYKLIRLFAVFPSLLASWFTPKLGSIINFFGYFYIILVHIYMPLCYNRALESISYKSDFEKRFTGGKVVNYGISALFTVFFVVLNWTQLQPYLCR